MKELERLVLGHIHIRQLYHPQACLPPNVQIVWLVQMQFYRA